VSISSQRQTLFFTATWPREVRKLASEFLSNPAIVYIGNTDTLVANKDVTQIVKVIDDMRGEKDTLVQEIIRNEGHGSRIIIFCSTKRMCDQLERSMSRMIPCSAIHGDKDQNERNRTLNEFKVMFSCLYCLAPWHSSKGEHQECHRSQAWDRAHEGPNLGSLCHFCILTDLCSFLHMANIVPASWTYVRRGFVLS
jgi:hypothetical protein